MEITPERVAHEHEWVRGRSERIVALINDVRGDLAELFETEVPRVEAAAYREAVDAVFADGNRAVNVAALVVLLRELDVEDDYPGFVVDELLGRELAALVAGDQPLRTLGEATFHYADLHVQEGATERAGADDLDAALAAGFQTRLPGWSWRERENPFSVRE
jgi:hypothetical protein